MFQIFIHEKSNHTQMRYFCNAEIIYLQYQESMSHDNLWIDNCPI